LVGPGDIIDELAPPGGSAAVDARKFRTYLSQVVAVSEAAGDHNHAVK